jgi:hypothetical protein
MKYLKKISIALIIIISLQGLTSCETTFIPAGPSYTNPSWAPPYYPGVRYYYLPDIEVYYDLSDREFVYLANGQWLFSPTLPSVYATYDLYNGFIIALNFNIYRPWLHHHHYVSHYPRYYYHNVYSGPGFRDIRGFNENDRKPIYWKQEERDRISDLKRNEKVEKRQEVVRQPQHPNYYGKNIGKPVKVKSKMKENKKSRPPK